ncbi:MAG: hypothetical protein LBD96_05275 [Treponema sp.]|nr:hypothetical protein [Treponema sp.]
MVHHILYEKGILIHFLETTVDEKIMVLFGVASSQVLVDAAVAGNRSPGIFRRRMRSSWFSSCYKRCYTVCIGRGMYAGTSL